MRKLYKLERVFLEISNTSKRVKKYAAPCFLTHYSVLGYPDEMLFLLFDILREYYKNCKNQLSRVTLHDLNRLNSMPVQKVYNK